MTLSGDAAKQYKAEHYKNNRDKYRESDRMRKRLMKRIVLEVKSFTPCADCGHQYHPAAMQFDHLPGFEKKAEVSNIKLFGSVKTLLEEMDKCEIVCANCHAVRTWTRLQD